MQKFLPYLLCLGLVACAGAADESPTTTTAAPTTVPASTGPIRQDASPVDVDRAKRIVLTQGDAPTAFQPDEAGAIRVLSEAEHAANQCFGYDDTRGNVAAEYDGATFRRVGTTDDEYVEIESSVEIKRTVALAEAAEAAYLSEAYDRCLTEFLQAEVLGIGDVQVVSVTDHPYGDDARVTKATIEAGSLGRLTTTVIGVRVDRALLTIGVTESNEVADLLHSQQVRSMLEVMKTRARGELAGSQRQLPVFTPRS